MRDVLSKALGPINDANAEGESTDRILAHAFFRTRPLQAGSSPIAELADRRGATPGHSRLGPRELRTTKT
jgi:hypothetical protein